MSKILKWEDLTFQLVNKKIHVRYKGEDYSVLTVCHTREVWLVKNGAHVIEMGDSKESRQFFNNLNLEVIEDE